MENDILINHNKIRSCRICGREFYGDPLLIYKNMPSMAQYLPNQADLETDKGIDLEVYQCSGCGLIQLNNRPVDYYREVIRATGVSNEMKEFRIQQFSDFINKYSLENKKIIETGCGRGEFLSILNRLNVDAYGLEYLENSVQQCVEVGLKVSQGFIENSKYVINNGPFDAFFIFNFLEHLPDVNSYLMGIYNNLTEDAVGIVEVPNFDMMLESNLFSEFTRDHLYYFTRETLTNVLTMNGFEVLECNEIWHKYIISAIVKKRKKVDLSGFTQQQINIGNEINQYIDKFSDKRVAIWGAGHQAFAIISLFDLDKRICYVVDSANFKQDKYTPSTHLPIVSPEKLKTDPVEAIIVMAGSYSDEVAKTIRAKYDNDIAVAILRDFGLEIFLTDD